MIYKFFETIINCLWVHSVSWWLLRLSSEVSHKSFFPSLEIKMAGQSNGDGHGRCLWREANESQSDSFSPILLFHIFYPTLISLLLSFPAAYIYYQHLVLIHSVFWCRLEDVIWLRPYLYLWRRNISHLWREFCLFDSKVYKISIVSFFNIFISNQIEFKISNLSDC